MLTATLPFGANEDSSARDGHEAPIKWIEPLVDVKGGQTEGGARDERLVARKRFVREGLGCGCQAAVGPIG